MSTERVLVVVDERKIRDVAGSYPERRGHEVALFEDGESALAATTAMRPQPARHPCEEVARPAGVPTA